jgi:D-3-phosphoglycerate dehydrogenase
MAGQESKKVLVTDSIAQSAIDILKHDFEVDVRLNMSPSKLKAAIGQYQALIVRSQTRVTGELIEAGSKLEVIAYDPLVGRASGEKWHS